jgi:hypothetical protein
MIDFLIPDSDFRNTVKAIPFVNGHELKQKLEDMGLAIIQKVSSPDIQGGPVHLF